MGASAYIRTQTLWVGGDLLQQNSKLSSTIGGELVMVTPVKNNFHMFVSFWSWQDIYPFCSLRMADVIN